MKVLLFSNDLMPFGNLPTSGGGLRCFQLMKGLESHGIEVIASMPAFTYLTERNLSKIPPEQKDYLWHFGTQDEIYKRVKPDAVIFASNWDHYNLSTKISVPLIIDLHGSRMIETKLFGAQASAEKKVQTLARADCLLTAGRRQRNYFYGWLIQAGRVPEDEHFIRYVPISLSSQLPARRETSEQFPYFVSGGGWFPWQNQSKAIFTLCSMIRERDAGVIEIYGTPHDEFGGTAEERLIRDIYGQVKHLATVSPRIHCHGYIGRKELIDVYRSAHVAVEAMEYNLERELAFTTRTVEYLWCGLPVIYNNYSELSDHIREYDAGWAIDPADEAEIRRVSEEIFSDPKMVRQKSENAARLVRDRFTWERTIQPLVDFLRAPRKMAEAVPVLGLVYARPSFLSARGEVASLPLSLQSSPLRQRFIVPAENISAIEIPVSLSGADSKAAIDSLLLTVRRINGQVLAKRNISGSDLPDEGLVTVSFPFFRTPRGGEELCLELQLIGKQEAARPVFGVAALCRLGYPFLSGREELPRGKNSRGEDIAVQSLALSFVPGEYSKAFYLKTIIARAFRMIRAGDWQRLRHAISRRIPGLIVKMREQTVSLVSARK